MNTECWIGQGSMCITVPILRGQLLHMAFSFDHPVLDNESQYCAISPYCIGGIPRRDKFADFFAAAQTPIPYPDQMGYRSIVLTETWKKVEWRRYAGICTVLAIYRCVARWKTIILRGTRHKLMNMLLLLTYVIIVIVSDKLLWGKFSQASEAVLTLPHGRLVPLRLLPEAWFCSGLLVAAGIPVKNILWLPLFKVHRDKDDRKT